MTTVKLHDCKDELREMNLRATPARIAVMQFLEKTKEPVDVHMVMEYLKNEKIDTDPATVFRIMNMFTTKGLTNSVQFHEGKARYELAGKDDHHHLICEQCGRIEDIEDTVLPALEKHISLEHHFVVRHHALEFFGLCNNCQK